MFKIDLTPSEYNAVINSRYVARWQREVNFTQQRGYVSLIKPVGQLVTLLHELGQPSRRGRFVNFTL